MSNNDYLYQDTERVNLDHPDSAIRLAAVVHRFRVPKMNDNNNNKNNNNRKKVSFKTSFSTAGRHDKTDDHRERLRESTAAEKISSERVVNDARRYIPQIHNVLV